MAKVVRNIELTEEESQILVKACALIRSLVDGGDLGMTSINFFEQLDDIYSYNDISTGQDLNGKIIEDDYDDYEFKIVDK